MMTNWACLKVSAVSTVLGGTWSPPSTGAFLSREWASIMSVAIAFKSVENLADPIHLFGFS